MFIGKKNKQKSYFLIEKKNVFTKNTLQNVALKVVQDILLTFFYITVESFNFMGLKFCSLRMMVMFTCRDLKS